MENKEEVIDMKEKIRISPRISRRTRSLARALYPVMGVTLEERIEFFLAKDLAMEMKKTWFRKMIKRQADDQFRSDQMK